MSMINTCIVVLAFVALAEANGHYGHDYGYSPFPGYQSHNPHYGHQVGHGHPGSGGGSAAAAAAGGAAAAAAGGASAAAASSAQEHRYHPEPQINYHVPQTYYPPAPVYHHAPVHHQPNHGCIAPCHGGLIASQQVLMPEKKRRLFSRAKKHPSVVQQQIVNQHGPQHY